MMTSRSSWISNRGARLGMVLAVLLRSLPGPPLAAASSTTTGELRATQAACACPDPYRPSTPAGIVWQGPGPEPDLPRMAHLLAPVLWFSSDEPLIVLRAGEPLVHLEHTDDGCLRVRVPRIEGLALITPSASRWADWYAALGAGTF